MPGHKVPVRPILTEPWREVNSMEALMEDFSEQIALGIKAMLEKCFERELLAQLETAWGKHNPDRVDYRNGYRYRSLQTRLGVAALLVARPVEKAGSRQKKSGASGHSVPAGSAHPMSLLMRRPRRVRGAGECCL